VLGLFLPAPHAAESPPVKLEDTGKRKIERPLEHLVKSPKAATDTAVKNQTGASDFVNPKVEPGKVKWHADFDAACAAATKSGKPVLLFQMMGKLDDQFC